ncbi:hypothetical protein BH10PSE4_BH10PSE4_39720 [soil metagenome]
MNSDCAFELATGALSAFANAKVGPRRESMARVLIRSSWLAKGFMLLGALLLILGPIAPAHATPMDCCADAPCHDVAKSACPEACVVACQAIVAPELLLSEPVGRGASMVMADRGDLLAGRAIAPELPPPR